MNDRGRVGIGMALILLSACASRPSTIADLPKQRLDLDKLPVSEEQAPQPVTVYRDFLETTPVNHPLYREALARLADLEMEQGAQKQVPVPVTPDDRSLQEPTMTASLDEFRNAVKTYERLLRADPNYPRADWVLYQLARAYDQLGQFDATLNALDRLLALHNKPRFHTEAWFRKGEIHFAHQRYIQAIRAYQQVLNGGPESAFYDKALYKLGWTHLKLNRYRLAVNVDLQIRRPHDTVGYHRLCLNARHLLQQLLQLKPKLLNCLQIRSLDLDSHRCAHPALQHNNPRGYRLQFWSGREPGHIGG